MTRWLSGFLTMALLLVGVSTAHATIPKMHGWSLRFSDDFLGPAGRLPSRARWRFDIGHNYPAGPPKWGTGEIETYTDKPANVALDGAGHLRITPLRDHAGNWTSARIESTSDTLRPPKGGVLRIEARIQMPNVTGKAAEGYWPAFWALGRTYRRDGKWPQAGEFDIMENVNGLNSVWGILHCGVYPGGPCGEPSGLGRRSPCAPQTCQAAFHVYAFEWDNSVAPMELRWYVDGKLFDHVSQSQLPAATWKEITGQGGYFLLLNVAMGGGFSYTMAGGKPTPNAGTESGHSMWVDYVAVWTHNGKLVPATTASGH
jgi:hypothetical protein